MDPQLAASLLGGGMSGQAGVSNPQFTALMNLMKGKPPGGLGAGQNMLGANPQLDAQAMRSQQQNLAQMQQPGMYNNPQTNQAMQPGMGMQNQMMGAYQ